MPRQLDRRSSLLYIEWTGGRDADTVKQARRGRLEETGERANRTV